MTDLLKPEIHAETRHPGLVLREELQLARIEGAATLRQAQREAARALAPALKDLGKPLTTAGKRDLLKKSGTPMRPATHVIMPDKLKAEASTP